MLRWDDRRSTKYWHYRVAKGGVSGRGKLMGNRSLVPLRLVWLTS